MIEAIIERSGSTIRGNWNRNGSTGGWELPDCSDKELLMQLTNNIALNLAGKELKRIVVEF